jgi:hypothetical protein
MFLHGPSMPVAKRLPALEPGARIALNVSPYVTAMRPIVAHHVARYPNLVYIPQDLDTLAMLVHAAREVPGSDHGDLPDHLDHPLFAQDRVRFYVEPWPWIADLREADFSFGSRIHGNITALVAGTPAYVLAHDSRTLELARWFGIPHRLITDADATLDAADLYEEADYRSLVEEHPARFAVFQAYLRQHGLPDCFADGDGGAAFDARVAETPFPPAVRTGSPDAGSHLDVVIGRARNSVRALARKGPLLRVRRALAGRPVRRS